MKLCQNRHHFSRLTSKFFSFSRICISLYLTNAVAPIATAATIQSHSSTDISALMNGICTFPPSEIGSIFSTFLGTIFIVVLAAVFISSFLTSIIEYAVDRKIKRDIASGKLPPLPKTDFCQCVANREALASYVRDFRQKS